jgi:hypothetical protein
MGEKAAFLLFPKTGTTKARKKNSGRLQRQHLPALALTPWYDPQAPRFSSSHNYYSPAHSQKSRSICDETRVVAGERIIRVNWARIIWHHFMWDGC